MIPFQNPLVCHYPNKHNDTFVIQCCKNKDYCNKDLRPVLGPPKIPGRVIYVYLTLHGFFSKNKLTIEQC